jgi:hypothetical protein
MELRATGKNLPNFRRVLKISKEPVCCVVSVHTVRGQQLRNYSTSCDESYGRITLHFLEPLMFLFFILRIIVPKNVNSLVRLSTDFS